MNQWMSSAIASQLNDPWASSYQPEADALFALMTPAPDPTRKGLINDFIIAVKAGGVWGKLDRLLVMVSHSEQAGTLNWVNPSEAPAQLDGYSSWVSDLYFQNDGDVVFDTSSILTGFIPSSGVKFSSSKGEMGYYLGITPSVPSGSSAWRPLMGATDVTYNAALSLQDHLALPGSWCLSTRKSSNRLEVAMATDVKVQTPANTLALGLTAVAQPNPTGDPGLRVWKQGSPAYTLDVYLPSASKSRPSIEVSLGAVNFGAGSHFSSNAAFCMFYAGTSLSIAERNVLVAALETFRAAV